MKKYILSLMLAFSATCAMAQEAADWTVVACPEPGKLVSTLQDLYGDDWTTIEYLKVTGMLNNKDLELNRISELKIFDMGEATFADDIFPRVSSSYNMFKCPEIVLPASIVKISEMAFSYHPIQKITFGAGEVKLNEIRYQAFYQCGNLREFNISTVKNVGDLGFYGCGSFDPKTVSGLEVIGEGAFDGSGITEVYEGFFAPTVTTIPKNAFSYCYSLESAYIPDHITVLGERAFFYSGLRNLRMSNRIESIGYECFYSTNIKELNIPATIKEFDPNAISYVNGLEVLSCASLLPPGPLANLPYYPNLCKLKVPGVSKDVYRNTAGWNQFRYIEPLDSIPSVLLINSPLSDDDVSADFLSAINGIDLHLRGITQEPDRVGQFSVNNSTLNFRNWESEFKYYTRYNREYPYYIPTLVNNGTITAENLSVKMTVERCTWNFFTLPFDAKVSEIEHAADTYVAVRSYDGSLRAQNQSGWTNMEPNDIMEAGKGYILYVYASEAEKWSCVKFHSVDNDKKNGMFVNTDVVVPLQRNFSYTPWLDSWNLIGNPYPAYVSVADICDNNGNPFTAPITVWGEGNYYAYSPIDDELVLLPFESVFVQCPEGVEGLKFQATKRMHYSEALDYRVPGIGYRAPSTSGPSRQIFNFYLSDGSSADRTRIVLNENASLAYEVGRDAAKITDMVEKSMIFVASDERYAICERPLADATATLGVQISTSGSYTISLDGKFANSIEVLLTDNATGATATLTSGDYTFAAAAGEDTNRFTIQFNGVDLSGIGSTATSDDDYVTVTNVAGIKVFDGRKADFVAPVSGIYIMSDGDTARKIFVNK